MARRGQSKTPWISLTGFAMMAAIPKHYVGPFADAAGIARRTIPGVGKTQYLRADVERAVREMVSRPAEAVA